MNVSLRSSDSIVVVVTALNFCYFDLGLVLIISHGSDFGGKRTDIIAVLCQKVFQCMTCLCLLTRECMLQGIICMYIGFLV